VSSKRNSKEEALDRLVIELRELPAPDLDWDRVEARLMNEPRPAASSLAQGFLGRFRLPVAALVAVAAGVFVFAPHHAPTATALAQPKLVAQVASGPLNGDTVPVGTRITAGNQNIVVEHAGRARWTLDPRATASVTDSGKFLTVRLESGAISAAVVPKLEAETFAVEVGGTRIAVHGTAFRVEKIGDRVLVEVTEGVVAVEPTSTHSDPSFLLRRGSRGSFGLDGRTGSVEGNASVIVRGSGLKSHREIARRVPTAPQAASAEPAASAPAVSVPEIAPPPASAENPPASPEQPSISDIESGVSTAVDLMTQCFQKTHSNEIHVSVSTSMTLSVAGDGTVQSVTFGPPLAPAVEDCGVAGLRNLTFARSVEGATFTRILELKR
jgi:ferric-dicitrate binding protein FerR (iron transport regulator)